MIRFGASPDLITGAHYAAIISFALAHHDLAARMESEAEARLAASGIPKVAEVGAMIQSLKLPLIRGHKGEIDLKNSAAAMIEQMADALLFLAKDAFMVQERIRALESREIGQ